MGQVISEVVKDSEEETKEQLEILQEMARSIMDAQSERMAASALGDKTLPIVAVVDTKKSCHLDVNSGVGDHVSEVVGSLFDGKFMEGFKHAVEAAVETFLGNAEAGKQESTDFHVVYDKGALLRIDVYMYKYQFSSEALKSHGENLFCYVAQVAVLDSLAIDPTVTLYEMTKSIGKITENAKQEFLDECEFVETFIKSLTKLKQTQTPKSNP